MKLYEITIHPLSAFGTSLKGDTVFGHFCWQAAYNPSLIECGFENALAQYNEKPFAVFSSAYPKIEKDKTQYVLKRPDIPLSWIFSVPTESRQEYYENMKLNKAKKWMLLEDFPVVDLKKARLLSDSDLVEETLSMTGEETRDRIGRRELGDFFTIFLQPHNTIHRLTGTTGKGEFAPYSVEGLYYFPGAELVLFVLVDETLAHIDRIAEGLAMVGRFGFGKDASIGMGRFEVLEKHELPLPDSTGANACYTLAPCVPEQFERAYFAPFIRYGKHGDRLAKGGNPFKEPVIMSDEGAVFFPGDTEAFDKPYIGRAITNVSKAQPEAVVQGYAPYLPLKMEH